MHEQYQSLSFNTQEAIDKSELDPNLGRYLTDILPEIFKSLKPDEPLPPEKKAALQTLIDGPKEIGPTPKSTLIHSLLLCGFQLDADDDGSFHFTHFKIPEGIDPKHFENEQSLLNYWTHCLLAERFNLDDLTKEAAIYFARSLTPDQAAQVAKSYRRRRLIRGNGNLKENWQQNEHQVSLVVRCLPILKANLGLPEYYLTPHDRFVDVLEHFIQDVNEYQDNLSELATLYCVGLALLTLSPSLKAVPSFYEAYQKAFNARWPHYIAGVHKPMSAFVPKDGLLWTESMPEKAPYRAPLFDWSVLSKKQRHCILATLSKEAKTELFKALFEGGLTPIKPSQALRSSANDQVKLISNPLYLNTLIEILFNNKVPDQEHLTVDAIAEQFIEQAGRGELNHASFTLWPLLLACAASTRSQSVQSLAFHKLLSQAYTLLFAQQDEDFFLSVRRNLRDAFGEYKGLWKSMDVKASVPVSVSATSEQTDEIAPAKDSLKTNASDTDLEPSTEVPQKEAPLGVKASDPNPTQVPQSPVPTKPEAAHQELQAERNQTQETKGNQTVSDRSRQSFIGRVTYIGTFPYWEPIAKKIGSRFVEVTAAEAKYEFPHFGRVRIDPHNILNEYLYSIDFAKGDLQANVDSKTLLERTDTLYYVHSNQLMDEQRFAPIDQSVGYAVVYPQENGVRRNETVQVSFGAGATTDFAQCADIPVVLAVDGGFIGPYRLNQTQQGTLTINLPIHKENGIVKIYRPRHDGALLCIHSAGPVQAVALIHDQSLFTQKDYDVFNDYILMGKFVRALQLSKKERQCALRWSEQYSSLQHVFSDNPGIKSSRIQRIKSLLTDEAWLTSLYEIFDEEFELYKSGKEKRYASLKPQIERLESQNQELLSTIESLKKQSQTLEKALKEQTVKAERAQEDFNKATAEKAQATALPAAQTQTSALQAPVHQQALMQYMQHESVGACLREMMAQEHCDNRQERIDSAIREVARVPVSELSRQALAQYLIESVQRYRGYSKNDILNAFIVMTQNFLTVFSGQPGSGKTSLCNIIAHVLGISSLSAKTGLENADRFLPVSVERGWTGKRDFIGYYNPLNKHFESVDPLRYEAFGLLDKEYHQGSRLPFMMLLDEANLSPMEYYWADFMNVGDGACAMNFINLGDNHRYYLPKTLRFVATINNDHTTETLSPRLIDRAWTIVLPSMSLSESYLHETDTSLDPLDPRVQLISWQALESTFGQQSINPQDEALLWEPIRIFGESFTQMHPISPRTRTSMLHYLNVAGKYFDGARESASDLAVVQKLLPQINGTGQEYAQWLNDLLDKAKLMNWPRTVAQIERILREGRKSMGYYHFF